MSVMNGEQIRNLKQKLLKKYYLQRKKKNNKEDS